jgi:hypothetical protein
MKSGKYTKAALVAVIALLVAAALAACSPDAGSGVSERTAPLYDPNFVLETEFEITPTPDKYTLAISSVPGIMLHIDGRASGRPTMRYECESGHFGMLEDGKITTFGSETERPFGSAPSLHWTPDEETKDGDKITISLIEADGALLTARTFAVRVDDAFRYTLEQVRYLANDSCREASRETVR